MCFGPRPVSRCNYHELDISFFHLTLIFDSFLFTFDCDKHVHIMTLDSTRAPNLCLTIIQLNDSDSVQFINACLSCQGINTLNIAMELCLSLPCLPILHNLGGSIRDYYPYRAFGGQNKIVYSTRFLTRRAIILLLPRPI